MKTKNTYAKIKQITKADANITYYFDSRWGNIKDARFQARDLNECRSIRHAYYIKVQEKGVTYYDVRACKE